MFLLPLFAEVPTLPFLKVNHVFFLQFFKGPVKLDNLLNTYPHGLEKEKKKNPMNFFQLDSTVAELVLLRIVSVYEFSVF